MIVELKNENITAKFNTLGAETVGVNAFGKERSWQNDNGSWAGHAPVLFPYAGLFEVVADGVSYDRPRHGFARKSEFEIAEKTDSSVTFMLKYNERTLADYPYKFILYVTYTLDGGRIDITYKVENADDKRIYFACGGHDSFNTFGSLDGYKLEFEKEETFDNLLLDGEGRRTGGFENIGKGKILDIPCQLLENSATVVFGNVKSRKVTLYNPKGEKCVEVGFKDYSNLLLWHSDGSEMICIEPWSNLPDNVNEKGRDISLKEGVFAVEKGCERKVERYIEYFEI